jgi:NAD(P)-dependent dehydrogenase (short-subunit alcohol dehydrogenase family)
MKNTPVNRIWTHERCLVYQCDVRLKHQVEAAVKACIEKFGQLDIVVKFIVIIINLITVVLDGEY